LEIIKEKSIDDIDQDKSFLMSLVPSFKKLNDGQKFIAKVEFLTVMRHTIFYQRPYHVINPPQFSSYSKLPGTSAHTSYVGILPSVKIPSVTHHKVCNDFQRQHIQSPQNSYSEFTPSRQRSTSINSSTPVAHMPPSDRNTCRNYQIPNCSSYIGCISFSSFKKKVYFRATTNIRQVSYMMLC
jgi:hypothetical protein